MRARDTSPPKPETQLRLDPPAMTLMLANILNPKEAGLVAADGVDLVDFSDPSRGPIGDLPFDVIAKGVKAIAERSRISAALGDPPYKQDALIAHALKLREAGVNAVRFAVSAGDLDRSEHALKDIADTVDLVGVMFADQKPDFDLIPRLGKIGFKGVLLDVAQKGGRLFDHVESPKLAEFCGLCGDHNINAALAGSLQAPDVPRLLSFVNRARLILCFRSALRVGGKLSGALDPKKIALIRDLIPREGAAPEAPAKAGSKKAAGARATPRLSLPAGRRPGRPRRRQARQRACQGRRLPPPREQARRGWTGPSTPSSSAT